ncbi:MAG: hypothetical protein M1812_002844 [Candelaria pacifica]|nr:MAG: hypothetical protein M1812_002844 [Candelaria pacifica]
MIIQRRLARCSTPDTVLRPLRQSYQVPIRISIGIKQQRLHTNNGFFKVSEEIREAIQAKRPVVALESTIYTHGFPYPDNVALASHLESLVRVNGGVPATIGVVDGAARVGLSPEELISLASQAKETMKVSRRDLSFTCGLGVAGKRINGGTTVAGTMVLAHLAGIRIFATGGLGGVHRGGESSMDISADLTELGRTPVAVISSGCKSFLDIARTLEYLETQGVGVATFRDCEIGNVDFPAFWTRQSGITSPAVLEDEREAAAMIYAHSSLSLTSGLLLANPIPSKNSIAKSEMDNIIATAINDAEAHGITGNAQTPFILERIRNLTNGRSVEANRALVSNNVIRGTQVAVELAKLEREGAGKVSSDFQSQIQRVQPVLGNSINATHIQDTPSSLEADKVPYSEIHNNIEPVDVLVAGSFAIDLSCDYKVIPNCSTVATPQLHTSNPSTITQNLGGVSYNVARAVQLMGASVRLCSAVGEDLSGLIAHDSLASQGLDSKGVHKFSAASGCRTAQYVAINDTNKDLVLAMSDMSIHESTKIDFSTIWQPQIDQAHPKWLIVDTTWHATFLHKWISAARSAGACIALEPVSAAKSPRIFAPIPGAGAKLADVFPSHVIDLVTPNVIELAAMHTAAEDFQLFESQEWWRTVDALGIPSSGARNKLVAMTNADLIDQGIPQMATKLLPFMPCIVTKLGAQGVLMMELLHPGDDRLTSPDAAEFILSRSDGDDTVGGIYMRLFPPAEIVPQEEILSVNGIGDTLLGVLIAGLVNGEGRVENLIDRAQRGSVMTLKCKESVHPELGRLRYTKSM